MKQATWLVLFIAFVVSPTLAQSAHERDKVNVFVGFSHNRVETGIADDESDFGDFIDERTGFNGFNASVTGNVSRYVGLKFDVSGHYNKSETLTIDTGIRCVTTPCPSIVTFRLRSSLYNFLGGVQLKDNSRETRVKPFAHLLIGAAHTRTNTDIIKCDTAPGQPCPVNLNDSDTGFAGAFGGGLDIRMSDRIDFRAVQLDYNPTRINGKTRHNFRIGIGVVFR